MRSVFGTKKWRAPTDPVAIVAVQNFKHDVRKSAVSTHLAQYLAREGYRVLLVDCDSQASTTRFFNYVPDADIREDQTIYPFLQQVELRDIRYAIRPTHWDGLHLIPANLHLCAAEYDIVGRIARGDAILLDRLSQGIQSVADDYDVVILDPPFTQGMISLCVMRASNALLIPVQPSVRGFASATAFLAMLHDTMLALASHGYPVQLNWFKFLLSRTNDQNSMHREIASGMRNIYGGNHCLAATIESAEIDNASARSMTVYDLDNPTTSRIAHHRAVTHLNAVNREIEIEIRKTWPSHAKRLAKEGIA